MVLYLEQELKSFKVIPNLISIATLVQIRIYINMLQCKKRNKLNMPFKFRLGIFFCITILIVLFLFIYLNQVVNPVIIESSSAKTRSLSQKAVEQAIYETIQGNTIYDNLITINRDNEGNVTYISTNSLQINMLARELAKSAQAKLEDLGSKGINIPVGNFTGMPIFVGRGPNINIKLLPIGSISCKFNSEFKNAGINQTNHKIYLTVVSKVSVILPTANQTIETTTQIMIAESIIVGKIPDTYLNSASLDDMLNLIPN